MASTATAAAKKKLVVCGGNGFLGSRICKAAVSRGWQVTSVSRSGEPTWSSITSSPNAPSWAKSVAWEKANILQPSTYSGLLEGADAVVHSMGILLEADYKGVLQGKEPIVKGLQRAFSSTKAGTQNPLHAARPGQPQQQEEEFKPQEKDGQLTYEVMNRDTALILAREAAAKSVPSYVYISAAAGAPFLPSRYISTKREAESQLASAFPSIRSIFFRAPFLYDSSRTFTLPIATAGYMGSMVNDLMGGRLTWLMGAGGTKPLKADVVGEAVVEALEDESIRGPVEAREIEALGTKAWRKNML